MREGPYQRGSAQDPRRLDRQVKRRMKFTSYFLARGTITDRAKSYIFSDGKIRPRVAYHDGGKLQPGAATRQYYDDDKEAEAVYAQTPSLDDRDSDREDYLRRIREPDTYDSDRAVDDEELVAMTSDMPRVCG